MAYEIFFVKENSQDLQLVQFVANELEIVLKDPNGQFRGILEWTYHSAKRKLSGVKIVKLHLAQKRMACVSHYYSYRPDHVCDMRPKSDLEDVDLALFNDIVNDIMDKKQIHANIWDNRRHSVRQGLVRC